MHDTPSSEQGDQAAKNKPQSGNVIRPFRMKLQGIWKRLLAFAIIGGILFGIFRLFSKNMYASETIIYFPSSVSSKLGSALGVGGNADSSCLPLLEGLLTVPQPGLSAGSATMILKTRDTEILIIEKYGLTKLWNKNLDDTLTQLSSLLQFKTGDNGELTISCSIERADIAKGILELCLKRLKDESSRLSLGQAKKFSFFIKNKTSEARQAYDQKLQKLEDFLNKNEILPPDAQGDFLGKSYQDIKARLLDAEIRATSTNKVAMGLSSSAVQMVNKSIDPTTVSGESPLNTVYIKIVHQRENLALLLKQFTPTHPDVVLAQQALNELRRQLQIEVERLVRSIKDGTNPFVLRAIVDSVAARSEYEALRKTFAEVQQHMTVLPGRGTKYARLIMDIEIEKARLLRLQTELIKSELINDTQEQMFVVPEQPFLPPLPQKKHILLFVILGFIFGTVVGMIGPYAQWLRDLPQESSNRA